MRLFLAAASFLTRVPVGRSFQVSEVGRAARWFPLVGAIIGLIYCLIFWLFSPWCPPLTVAGLILVSESLFTGALHLDGLADMADGFGGGHTREEVLRIMRDHVIGSYGATALILVIVIKVTAIARLIELDRAAPYLIAAPVLSRWATVLLAYALPTARHKPGEPGAIAFVTDSIGKTEFLLGTVTASLISSWLIGWWSLVCWIAVVAVSSLFGWMCRRRIGGVTGDTLGANTEVCEAIVLLTALAAR